MPKPKTKPIKESFEVTGVESRAVNITVKSHVITKLVEDGEISAMSCIRGAEASYLRTLGLHSDHYISEKDNHWYQSGWGGDTPYRMRKATRDEIDVMNSFQDIRNALFSAKIIGDHDDDPAY